MMSAVLLYYRPRVYSDKDVWFIIAEFGVVIGLYLIIVGL